MKVELLPPTGMGPTTRISIRDVESKVFLHRVEGPTVKATRLEAKKWIAAKGFIIV